VVYEKVTKCGGVRPIYLQVAVDVETKHQVFFDALYSPRRKPLITAPGLSESV